MLINRASRGGTVRILVDFQVRYGTRCAAAGTTTGTVKPALTLQPKQRMEA